jgi:Ni/Co efflux regulator RcnB
MKSLKSLSVLALGATMAFSFLAGPSAFAQTDKKAEAAKTVTETKTSTKVAKKSSKKSGKHAGKATKAAPAAHKK